ncbi:unnamed protein product [Clonostachys rosea]|uniref:F-box domain-containing protein n=1 Tax=Bionectria ochroleuca TaxID=29856 RepID=A0ABY6UKH4_BIOOC|nr:unnamed protein product [Clonostachys rosea]
MNDTLTSGLYCSLCGSRLRDVHSIGPPPGEGPPHWTTCVRLVRKPKRVEGYGASSITGAGHLVGGSFVGPEDDPANLVGHEVEDLFDTHIGPDNRKKTFGCHEVCWQLLLLQISTISNHPPDPLETGSLLFDILDSTPWGKDGDLIPENNYFGALSMRQTEEGIALLNADPNEPLPPLDISTFSLEEHGLAVDTNFKVRPSGPLSHTDPFTNLPDETIQGILWHLPSKDVCSARLASRRLGTLGAIGNLPQSFWASRFTSNREMSFLFNLLRDAQPGTDWFRTYFCCKRELKHEGSGDRFINRRRIWRCLSDLSTILVPLLLHLELKILFGLCSLSFDKNLGQRVSSPQLPSLRITPNPEGQFQLGVRGGYEHDIFFPGQEADYFVEFEFSFVVLSSAEYISGYRVSDQRPGLRQMNVQQAGLIFTSTLTSFFLRPGDTILCVDVYISTSGIHSLKFLIETHGGIRIHKVGKLRRRHGIIAVKRLNFEPTTFGLKFGFDMYKAISVQLIEGTKQDLEVGPVALSNLPAIPPRSWELTPLLVPTPPEGAIFPVNLYVPFGGRDGSRLSSLRSITALVFGTAGVYGLRFTYSEGEPAVYGNREHMGPDGKLSSCVEQTLLIDGQNGERVIQFDLVRERAGRPDLAIHIVARTNFGQLYRFGHFDGFAEVKYGEAPPPDQSAIFAVIASVSAPDWRFQCLSSHTFRAPCPSRIDPAVPCTSYLKTPRFAPVMGPWMNLEEGSCFITASLEKVRRIRISQGADNRGGRSPSHISGLWIEYFDDRRDVIVGQWIEETGCFVLQPDERLVEVTVWSTTEVRFPHLGQGHSLGKISGIAFGTTRNRVVVRKMPAEMDDQTCLQYLATQFEDIFSITWAFNSRLDDVQVRLNANPLLGQNTLLFGQSGEKPRPFDPSQGHGRTYFIFGRDGHALGRAKFADHSMRYHCPRTIYFFEDVDNDGRPTRLTSIEMSPDAEGNIGGLAFHYDNGKVIQQGTLDDRSISLDLDHSNNEWITLLIVYEVASVKVGLEFRSNRDQSIKIMPQDIDIDSVTIFQLDPGAKWKDIKCGLPNRVLFFINPFYAAGPVESCIGMWTVSQRARPGQGLVFDDVGPIFMSTPESRGMKPTGAMRAMPMKMYRR